MAEALAARNRIIAENQAGGHEACRGCAHLKTKRWPKPKYAVQVVGIAQFARCNIYCNYCYLQTQDPASFEDGFNPYDVKPAIDALIRDGHLAPNALIDWGGGEPTIHPEFDEILDATARRGAKHWIHTNGTRFPKPIRNGLSTKRIHILCSVDAGYPETYLKMKQRDFLDLVWKNLAEYVSRGCEVVVKYIVKQENCSEPELLAFLKKAKEIGVRKVLIDIDYDYPNPTPEVLGGLRFLKRESLRHGLFAPFGFTGAKFQPELEVEQRMEKGLYPRFRDKFVPLLYNIRVRTGLYSALIARMLRPQA
jgi:sulfatase maturation enzyme AslB (radical SAM superfamily)